LGFRGKGGRILNISVCDDDVQERKTMIRHIGGYYYGLHTPISITEFDSVDLLVESMVSSVPDIVVVSLNGCIGIEPARHIRRLCGNCALIIMSNTAKYGIEAYNLQAADYLVKPVCYSQLCKALTRCEMLM